MASSLSGSYQPRCAVADRDEAFAAATSLPRRRAGSPSRLVRGAIAFGAAAAVGAVAVVTTGLTTNASASHAIQAAPAVTAPAEPGTPAAFLARGTSTDRSATRGDAADDIAAEAAERATTLDAAAEELLATEVAAAAATRVADLSGTSTAIDAEAKRLADKSHFFWPTEGGITSPWGMRLHPILRYTRLHGGADIGGAVGAPIYAAQDGIVTKAAQGYNGGSGNNVRIDHGTINGDALESAYLHMNNITVSEGQKVKRGQQIGSVGNTGLSTAPHLHFSVYVNGANSDPAPFLAKH